MAAWLAFCFRNSKGGKTKMPLYQLSVNKKQLQFTGDFGFNSNSETGHTLSFDSLTTA